MFSRIALNTRAHNAGLLALGLLLLLGLILTACDDDKPQNDDIDDLDTTEIDTVDPCLGLNLCLAEGRTCSGDLLLTCAPNSDGCLVESRVNCSLQFLVCDPDAEPAACVAPDPCAGLNTCDQEGRYCEGQDLVTCATDANGCIVENRTSCVGGDTNTCQSEPTPACAFDHCATQNTCTTPGAVCLDDTLVRCFPDAYGCLREEVTDCSTRNGGFCSGDQCSAENACDGLTNLCDTATSLCDGNNLLQCAPDPFGCLVLSNVACNDQTDGYCDANLRRCAIDSAHCTGKTLCQGEEPSRSCTTSQELRVCDWDDVGCLVETVTNCGANQQICSAESGTPRCQPPCTPAPGCESAAEGQTFCQGAFLETCTDLDDDGCLDLLQTDCAPGTCGLLGAVNTCLPPPSGDTCLDPILIEHSGFVLQGTDFTADFTDQISLDPTSCDVSATFTGQRDAIMRVDLQSGDRLVLNESGSMDVVRSILHTCANNAPCVASIDDPDEAPMEYIATTDETVFIVLEPFTPTPANRAYRLHVDINPACGNGWVEFGESCDDGNDEDGDGCSSTCLPEFGYTCEGQPSDCTPIVHLGDFGANATIQHDESKPYPPGPVWFTITFIQDILLSGELVPNTTGNPDFFLYSSLDTIHFSSTTPTQGEQFIDIPVPMGDYLIRIEAVTTLPDGFNLSMATKLNPGCGDGIIQSELGENCDDLNRLDGDGCSANCRIELGWNCSGEPSMCTEIIAVCGDGIIDGAESCEDGNAASGDGCSDTCQVEEGFACLGLPSNCFEANFTGTADSCLRPGVITQTPMQLVGTDFWADFSDSGPFTGAGCFSFSNSALVRPEAVFSLDLQAGEIVTLSEHGNVDVVLSILPGICDDTAACHVSSDLGSNESAGVTYTAPQAQTVFLVVETYYATSTSKAYDIRINSRIPSCGDGIVEGTETCDDGNDQPGDGCSDTCQIEAGWLCSGTPSSCRQILCGDGIVEGTEACDDGNLDDGDGCSSLCEVETGYSCFGAPSTCYGAVYTGSADTCADPGIISQAPFRVAGTDFWADFTDSGAFTGAGCFSFSNSSLVRPEAIFALELQPGEIVKLSEHGNLDAVLSILPSACGTTSPCSVSQDLGTNESAGVTYTATQLETVYLVVETYSATSTNKAYDIRVSTRIPSCGDGIVEGAETCDDGNAQPGDGCSDTCQVETGWLCTGAPSLCRETLCGDGIVEGTETCDDGNLDDGDGCSSLCAVETGFSCFGSPSTCYDATFTGGANTCADPGFMNSETLRVAGTDFTADFTNDHSFGGSGCTYGVGAEAIFAAVVTAGQIVKLSEHGNLDTVLRILPATCDNSATCSVSDDLGTNESAGVTYTATQDGVIFLVVEAYSASPSLKAYDIRISIRTPTCGDGIIEGAETCDDGDAQPGDGCSDTCQVETGWLCTGTPSLCRETLCGDGIVEGTETCDDGNLDDGDGCSSLCEVETGYSCFGSPSVCYDATFTGGANTCADPGDMNSRTLRVAGTDFTADFTNNHTFGGSGCTFGGGAEAIFTAVVAAGQIVKLSEHGNLDTVLRILPAACDNTATCSVSEDLGTNESAGVTYTATQDEVLFLVVEAYSASPSLKAYDIRISIRTPYCGDGIIEGAETCDDGDAQPGDGCSDTCQIETGWLCTGTPSLCRETLCGDGIVEGTETCDDGNLDDGDGCSSLCEVETGYSCFGAPSTCYGATYTGSALTCADPGIISGDSLRVAGSDFTADFTQSQAFATGCSTGNGVNAIFAVDLLAGQLVTLSEHGTIDVVLHILPATCDATTACAASTDGNETTGVSYLAQSDERVYLVTKAYSATPYSKAYDIRIKVRTPMCGDGIIDTGEACDDGNLDDGDGCSSLCQVETGFSCFGTPSVCYGATYTGSANSCTDPGIFTGNRLRVVGTNFSSDFTNDHSFSSASCDTASGADAIFAVDVIAGQRVKLSEHGALDAVLHIIRAVCANSSPCAVSDDLWTNESAGITYTATQDETLFLVVEAYGATTTSAYDIRVEID